MNFFGTTFDDYVACGAGLRRWTASTAGDERLLSQHQGGRHRVRHRSTRAWSLVRACRQVVAKPLWVKLTPNTSDIVALARHARKTGADGLSIINTITGMAIDARTRKPKIATIFGGLSGPAIKPIALRMVYQVHRAGVPLPISGIGGIQTALDAVEFLLAGATTVQVGTQNFVDPASAERIVRESTNLPPKRPCRLARDRGRRSRTLS